MKKKAAKKTTGSDGSKNDISGLTIGLQFADITWRVAVPIVVLTVIGIKVDAHYQTRPLFSLVGLFTSLALACFLVYKQLRAAYPEMFKKEGRK